MIVKGITIFNGVETIDYEEEATDYHIEYTSNIQQYTPDFPEMPM